MIADFADPASLDHALEGIESVFPDCSPVPQLLELEGNVALADLQTFYADGPGTSLATDVRRVLGRKPILFTQFLQEYAGHFATPTAIN